MKQALALVLAYAIDALYGEPPGAVHPVVWMGRAIHRGRDWALDGGRRVQLVRGTLVTLAVCGASAGAAFAVTAWLVRVPAAASVAAVALMLKPMFAARALREAAFTVRDAIARGDVPGARQALSSLCSRDAASLDAPSLTAAAVESVAENASDSIVAPVFYFGLFGLPGAVFYRAANTLDAMMGYRGRLEWAGKSAARLDDALNLIPARLTALLLLGAGLVVGADVRNGISTLRRDGARTESPNAGRPMAAMAGLLGVRLVKDGCYALGDARRAIVPDDITRAWRLVSVASALVVLVTGAWLGIEGER